MGDFLDLPTVIAIGVALFVLWRLRQVLGTRTGNERPPMLRGQRPEAQPARTADDTVVPLRPRGVEAPEFDAERRARKLEAEIEQFSRGDEALGAGLTAINQADPAFAPKSFLDGAKQAYEMIVTAFAQGDRRTLKNLLDKDVYDDFEAAIVEREAAGHTVDFTFVGLPKIEFAEASIDKKLATISIRFNAEVVSATSDASGDLVEGNAEQVVTLVDEWTFARNPRSRDPNWKLVATNPVS